MLHHLEGLSGRSGSFGGIRRSRSDLIARTAFDATACLNQIAGPS